MSFVRPKKSLGQHFLIDKNIARKIVNSLTFTGSVLEIGPGKGILTDFLIEKYGDNFKVVEIDSESVDYLKDNSKLKTNQLIHEDILNFNFNTLFSGHYAVIGNFPYNIGSQIFFKILDNRNQVDEVVCMIQREVALRIAEKPGSRVYGILSVLLQSFYNIEYLFTVNETVFFPPPNVKSAVIKLTRNKRKELDCDEKLFFIVVKTAFNQRRKTISNSLKSICNCKTFSNTLLTKRPEQLSVDEFIELTNLIASIR